MEFANLDEIYSYLESETHNLKMDWELTSELRKLANKTTNDDIKKKIKWECSAFDFYLENGDIKPVCSSIKEDGKTIYSYPSDEDFGEIGMSYLKLRATQTKNNFLFIRYNQILWNSPKPYKHLQQAKNVIDAYLNIFENINCINPEKKKNLDCLESMKN